MSQLRTPSKHTSPKPLIMLCVSLLRNRRRSPAQKPSLKHLSVVHICCTRTLQLYIEYLNIPHVVLFVWVPASGAVPDKGIPHIYSC